MCSIKEHRSFADKCPHCNADANELKGLGIISVIPISL